MAESTGGGLSVDTSSYPKAALPVSPLDIASKLGGLQQQSNTIQQQGLAIDQAKMDQANQALQYLTRALGAIGPNGTADQYKNAAKDAARTFKIPEDTLHVWDNKVDNSFKTTGSGKAFWDEAINTGQQHSEILNSRVGQPTAINSGAHTVISRLPIQGQPSVIGAVENQLPVTQGTVDQHDPTSPNYGGPTTIGRQPLPQTPGFGNRLGVSPLLPTGPMDPAMVPRGGLRPNEKVTSAEIMPPTNGAVPTGTSPNYQEGAKRYFEDSNLTTGKLQAIKPAMQALPLMEELTTGIGTDRFNQVLAGLHNLGVLPPNVTDKVTAYQIITKKLADYVRTNPIGQRSDAAQALSEAASPNPKAQISPALIKLTKDAISLDLGQAIRAPAFATGKNDAKGKPVTDESGNPVNYSRKDYENYLDHSRTFPSKVDERAIGLPIMKPEDAKALLLKMDKLKDTPEGKKFKYTIDMMKKLDVF